jgi:hypothetical protein
MESEVYYRISMNSQPVPILIQTNLIHTLQSYFLRTHLILYFHLRLDLPTGFFLGLSSQNYVYIYHLPMCATFPAHLTLTIWSSKQYLMKTTNCGSPHCATSLQTPVSKYSHQHRVLRHPPSMFLPQSQRPSFPPILKSR